MKKKSRFLQKKIKKRLLTSFFIGLISSIALTFLYLYMPQSFQNLDGRLRDFLFLIRGHQTTSAPIVIIDIDEKSLKELGQFPWERSLIATLLQKASDANALIIGLDVSFVEADKRSPSFFAHTLNLQGNFANYDKMLADTIKQTPTILGYAFDFNTLHVNKKSPNIPAVFIERGVSKEYFLPHPKGILSNLPIIQNAAYSSGFFNSMPDSLGVVRSIPLLMKYDMEIYPSLAFEMYRIATDNQNVKINYSTSGVENIQLKQTTIQTDRHGRIYLNYKAPKHAYTYISASDIIQNKVDTSILKDKFLFLGTSAIGLLDLRSTPFDNTMPGVEIHANALDNLLNQDYLKEPMFAEIINILIIVALSFFIAILFSSLSPILLVLSFLILIAITLSGYYYFTFYHFLILNILYPLLSIIICTIAVLATSYFLEQRQKESIKSSFAKKVSKNVMDDLLELDTTELFGGQEREITIFFSDIRGFSTLAETLPPKKLIELLNTYMSPMSDFIIQHKGTIDKFIGDAIMAYWNAPQTIKNHADEAVKSALDQIAYKKELNQKLDELYQIKLDFGIGINTGLAIVGEMGSSDRSDYTVVGNSVNLASRLEGLCPVYGVDLIFSSFTKDKLITEYTFLKLDTIRVKGIHAPVDIYTILEANEKNAIFVEGFEKALHLYQSGNFEGALKFFSGLSENKMVKLENFYINRCQEYIQNRPKNFDGIYTHLYK